MRLIIPIVLLVLFSCKKKEDCVVGVDNDNDNYTDTVVVGWPIKLKSNYAAATVTNEWSGPNNWTRTTKNGEAETVVLSQAGFSDAGDYQVKSYSYSRCLLNERTIHVKVIDPPSAPCPIPDNYSHITSPGDFEANYMQFNTEVVNGQFVVEAYGSSGMIRFSFATNAQEPKPGIYMSNVSMTNPVSSGILYMDANQRVYVQKLNGQLVLSFCNAVFFDQSNPEEDVIVTAKITVP